MKNFKRILAAVLAMSMLLTGCSNSTDDSSSSTDSSSSSSSSTDSSSDDSTSTDDSIFTESGYPVVQEGEEYTISVFARYRIGVDSYEYADSAMTQWFTDTTGISIEWTAVADADRATQLNLMLASGEYTDVILEGYFTASEQYVYGTEQGILADISEYIYDGETAPNLQAAFEEYSDVYINSAEMPDGEIYSIGIFGVVEVNYTPYKLWINQTWLDNLGLDNPTTTEEYYEVLTAFKEQDANGNGDPDDEIPLTGSTNGWNTDPKIFFINSFVPYNPGSNYFYADDDDTLHYAKTDDGLKEALIYLNTLVEEGLLDELAFSQDNDSLKAIANASGDNVIGSVPGGYTQSVFNFGETNIYEYVAVEPLEGPDGAKYAATAGESTSGVFSITTSCEYPEAVMRAFDLFYTEEGLFWSIYGVEGIDWVYADEGLTNYLGEPAYVEVLTAASERDNRSWNQLGSFSRSSNSEYSEIEAVDMSDPESLTSLAASLSLYNAELYSPYKYDSSTLVQASALIFDADDTVTVANYLTALDNYSATMIASFIVGDIDIEEEWDNYVAQMEAYGSLEYTALYQAAYDVYIG